LLIEILNQTLVFPNKREAVPEIIQSIEQELNLAEVYYSHFTLDGVDRFDELESFLLDNITGTEKIKIECRTLKELADEVILSAGEYLDRAIPVLTELAPKFYRESNADCWRQLAELTDGVKWLLDSFSLIDKEIAMNPHIQGYSNWNEYLQQIYSLKENMEQLGQAMESRDMVLIGDLLNYEVIDLFKQIKKSLGNMLPWEA